MVTNKAILQSVRKKIMQKGMHIECVEKYPQMLKNCFQEVYPGNSLGENNCSQI